jgi:uncharacterized protein
MRRPALLLVTASLVFATAGIAAADSHAPESAAWEAEEAVDGEEDGDGGGTGDLEDTAPAEDADDEDEAAAAAEGDDGFAVLVYTRTTDFRHISIPDAIAAVEELGEEHGFEVEATEDPDAFTDENLARFDLVMFLLTTGDVVEAEGEEAFERYVRGGGGWMGVHSAADTEYDWEFYGELLAGAYFHSHPVQQPGRVVVEDTEHRATAHLGEEWLIPFEEYYSFVANPRDEVRVLLSIDEDSYAQDPNTTHIPRRPEMPEGESGVMGDHPMAWCHEIDEGHAFYTAFGHEGYLYRTDEFREHLLGGILTAAGQVEADCAPQEAAADDPGGDGSDAGSDDSASEQEEDGETAEPEVAAEEPPPADGGPALPATGGSVALGLLALGLGGLVTATRRGRVHPGSAGTA